MNMELLAESSAVSESDKVENDPVLPSALVTLWGVIESQVDTETSWYVLAFGDRVTIGAQFYVQTAACRGD
jgi:hypothetical protein